MLGEELGAETRREAGPRAGLDMGKGSETLWRRAEEASGEAGCERGGEGSCTGSFRARPEASFLSWDVGEEQKLQVRASLPISL